MHKQYLLSITLTTLLQHWAGYSLFSFAPAAQIRFKNRPTFGYFTDIWWWSDGSVPVNPVHIWINSNRNKYLPWLLDCWTQEAGWEQRRFLLNYLLCYQLAVLHKKNKCPSALALDEWDGFTSALRQVPHHRALGSPETTSAAHHHAHVTFPHHSTADSEDNSGSKKTGETYKEQNRNQRMKNNHHP